MKITFDWIKDHLDTKFKEDKLLEELTNVGLEVESIGFQSVLCTNLLLLFVVLLLARLLARLDGGLLARDDERVVRLGHGHAEQVEHVDDLERSQVKWTEWRGGTCSEAKGTR